MRLVALLQCDETAALTATEAVIRIAARGHRTYRRKPANALRPSHRALIWGLGP
jgi:hypothetical protein